MKGNMFVRAVFKVADNVKWLGIAWLVRNNFSAT